MPIKPHPTDPGKVVFVSHKPILKLEMNPEKRPWVALTEDEIWTLHDSYPNPVGFARAIEAKLKDKNT